MRSEGTTHYLELENEAYDKPLATVLGEPENKPTRQMPLKRSQTFQ